MPVLPESWIHAWISASPEPELYILLSQYWGRGTWAKLHRTKYDEHKKEVLPKYLPKFVRIRYIGKIVGGGGHSAPPPPPPPPPSLSHTPMSITHWWQHLRYLGLWCMGNMFYNIQTVFKGLVIGWNLWRCHKNIKFSVSIGYIKTEHVGYTF